MTAVRPDASWTSPTSFVPPRMSDATAAPIRVLLAEADPAVRDTMTELLDALGHTVLGRVTTGAEAVAAAAALRPDVVLLDVALLAGPDGISLDDVAEHAPTATVVLFSGDPNVRLGDREVDASAGIAYLPQPVPPGFLDSALRHAVRRTRVLNGALREAEEARRQLEHRKLIERAKGVLMRRTGTTEAEAYSILRRQSQDRSKPMVDIARAVLESEPGHRA